MSTVYFDIYSNQSSAERIGFTRIGSFDICMQRYTPHQTIAASTVHPLTSPINDKIIFVPPYFLAASIRFTRSVLPNIQSRKVVITIGNSPTDSEAAITPNKGGKTVVPV